MPRFNLERNILNYNRNNGHHFKENKMLPLYIISPLIRATTRSEIVFNQTYCTAANKHLSQHLFLRVVLFVCFVCFFFLLLFSFGGFLLWRERRK